MSNILEKSPPAAAKNLTGARHAKVDADGHVMEPADLWLKYMPARLRDRAPRAVTENVMSSAAMIIDGVEINRHKTKAYVEEDVKRYEADKKADFSPSNQLAGMDQEGISAAVLFPTRGLIVMGVNGVDPVITTEAATAYNRWLHEFCSGGQGRLYGVGMVDPRDVDSACKEARRCVDEYGFTGIFLRPNPVNDTPWHDPVYEPLWAQIAALDVPVCFHEGSKVHLPQIGPDRFSEIAFWHVCSHPMEQQMAMLSMVMGGVAARHPRLRMAFLECGAGWLPNWLWRMDEHHEHYASRMPDLTMPPSEYARRQCFVSIDSDEQPGMWVLNEEMESAPRVVWGSDYPHPDSKFPHAMSTLASLKGMESERFRRVLLDAPKALYGERLKV